MIPTATSKFPLSQYGELQSARLCVSSNKGSSESELFGSWRTTTTMTTADTACPIDENLPFYGWTGASRDDTYNYIVKKACAVEKQPVAYAVKKVTSPCLENHFHVPGRFFHSRGAEGACLLSGTWVRQNQRTDGTALPPSAPMKPLSVFPAPSTTAKTSRGQRGADQNGWKIAASGEVPCSSSNLAQAFILTHWSYPRPRPDSVAKIGEYGQGKGKQNTWGYYDDGGNLILTHGTPAAMPMYHAERTMEQEIKRIAREVFR